MVSGAREEIRDEWSVAELVCVMGAGEFPVDIF